MKKYLQLLLLTILIVPSVTFASWWNPFTWSIFHWRQTLPPVVQQVPTSTTTENVQTDNTETEISSLKKEIEDLKAKDNQPRPATPIVKSIVKNTPTTAPKVVETPKIIPVIVSTAPANPASQCLSTKKDWDIFAKALTNLNMTSVVNSYYDLSFGTENRPPVGNALYAYAYTLMMDGKSKFYAQTSKVRDLVNSLPALPYGTDDDLQTIKKGYLDALTHLENSYNLSLQAYKPFGDNPDNYISQTEVSAGKSLYNDAIDEYNQVSPSLKIAYNKISSLQTDMQNGKVPNCNFTFKTDRTVITTIESENLFTQQMPKSNANNDGSTTVSVTTKLPVEVSENGQTKKVLELLCNPSSQPETLSVNRLNDSSVGTVIKQTNSRHQCVFIYTGNGTSIYSKMIDFNF